MALGIYEGERDMASVITVRSLDEGTQRALRHRAVDHGRSLEAEIRSILQVAARDAGRRRPTSTLAEAAERFRASVADLDFEIPERVDEQPREVFV